MSSELELMGKVERLIAGEDSKTQIRIITYLIDKMGLEPAFVKKYGGSSGGRREPKGERIQWQSSLGTAESYDLSKADRAHDKALGRARRSSDEFEEHSPYEEVDEDDLLLDCDPLGCSLRAHRLVCAVEPVA